MAQAFGHSLLVVAALCFSPCAAAKAKPWKECRALRREFDELDCNTACNFRKVNLLDFPQWRAETTPSDITPSTEHKNAEKSDGFWWGRYTFLGADGNPYKSSRWPYGYDHYYGFIRVIVRGNRLIQRNVFLYPPKVVSECTGSDDVVVGSAGVCGTNGAEKVFEAAQNATDCIGGLAGPYGPPGPFQVNTVTSLVGDGNAVLYQVSNQDYAANGFSNYAPFSNLLMQSQLTTFPKDGVRVRSAQGFQSFPGALPVGSPTYSSFYREHRVDAATWLHKLNEVRAEYNILAEDMCGYDGDTNAKITSPDCFTHFFLDDDFGRSANISCSDINGGSNERCNEQLPPTEDLLGVRAKLRARRK